MIKTQTNFVATSVERANDKTWNHEQSANDRDGQSSASDTGAEALGLVRQLAEHLDRRGIHYCHWKSNWRVRAAAQGLGDLDLLVRRSDARCFCEVMSGLGFRLVKDPGAKQLPGVLSFYGVDSSSGSWLHVHAHFQL